MNEDQGATDAQLADMVATAIALVTAFTGSDDSSAEVVEMLDELTRREGQTDFVETFKVVQGLLGVVVVLTDWYSQATKTPRPEVIRMIARENERRRPQATD